jgi:hypothetical protein
MATAHKNALVAIIANWLIIGQSGEAHQGRKKKNCKFIHFVFVVEVLLITKMLLTKIKFPKLGYLIEFTFILVYLLPAKRQLIKELEQQVNQVAST